MQRLRHHWIAVLLLGLCCLLEPAEAAVVQVVMSEGATAFTEASESLTLELARNGVARQDVSVLTLAEYLDAPALAADTRLVVSLGTEAFRAVLGKSGRAPVLAALIPRLGYERVLREAGTRPATPLSALYLDQPFGRQLDLLRLALPGVRRVAVLWGPESLSQQALLAAALQARNMEASEAVFRSGQPLIAALRSAMAEADALLAVADGQVFNPGTVSNILLTSYRAKLPVLAFSSAYVKAGALLSVQTTASQAGAQAAGMAMQYLHGNGLPASQYPNDFTISTNDYLARSLGLALDAKSLTERLHRLEKRP